MTIFHGLKAFPVRLQIGHVGLVIGLIAQLMTNLKFGVGCFLCMDQTPITNKDLSPNPGIEDFEPS